MTGYPMVHIVEVHHVMYVECRQMMPGGRACRKRWALDTATTAEIKTHLGEHR